MDNKQLIALYVALLSFSLVILMTLSSQGIVWGIVIMAVSVLMFLMRRESVLEIEKVYFRPIHLFLLSFVIIFYQFPLDYVLGVSHYPFGIGGENNMAYCVNVSTIGLLAFFIGYLKLSYKHDGEEYVTVTYKASPRPFAILAILFLGIVYATTPISVLMGGYGSEFTSGGNLVNYLLSWTSTFIIAYLVQHILTRDDSMTNGQTLWMFIRSIGLLENFAILAYFITILNIGDRGPIIIIAVAYYIAYITESHRSPSKKMMVTIMSIATIAMTLLGYTKKFRDNNDIVERISMLNGVDEMNKYETISPYTSELASSYLCLSYSVFNVPDNEDYQYGGYQFSYLWNVIPFSNSIYKSIGSSSDKITYFVQGPFPTHGNGSSCIADLYLDGGVTMIIIGMFAFGLAMRKFEYVLFCSSNISILGLCVSLYLCAHAIYIPRAMILFFIKYALWMFVILYVYNKQFGLNHKVHVVE